ncbi:fluoride efflux transporter FluC [Bifidobacterium canis]|uniref:Fluoride-specific ion channel n=1 Tax=Bifidobacterium canis TaxID=2610880 RepID=A0A7K1J684_9BIFI|nr:CrcB family protein [Bifidobacterium canis]MUH60176.1 camphor resistance protein CrcB [Bifidobacterium canis]
MELLAVGIGCAIGAVCRYLLEAGINNFAIDAVSILIINCLGCLLMGLFTGIIEKGSPRKIFQNCLPQVFAAA